MNPSGFDQHTIIERLVRMEEKQDHILEKFTNSHARIDGHETRIRGLETSAAKVIGMGAIIAGITGIAGSRILDVFTAGGN